jgi:YkoY family integral membrane protein
MLDRFLESSSDFGPDTLFILIILIALEAVLSADNAIALAAIAQGIEDPELQRRALNFGLLVAYVFRISLIFMATWILKYWQFEFAGALYLLWLVFQYFTSGEEKDSTGEVHPHHGIHFKSLGEAILLISFTDLAFSLDSVTTAIAISDRIWLIVVGGTIGVIALRFLAGLFIRWLKEYIYLEDAGYITVGLVGGRLLLRVLNDSLVPPQWLTISAIALIFAWGFSKRKPSLFDGKEEGG